MFYRLKEYLKDNKIIFISVLIIIIFIVLVIFLFNKKDSNTIKEKIVKAEIVKEEKKEIEVVETCKVKVDIKGYVINPGLYEVECDARVIDVINMAGGLKNNADTSVINLGKKVFDQMVIVIYSKYEVSRFIEVKQEEKIKEEKCKCEEVIKNDACVTSSDRLDESNIIISDNNNDNSDTSVDTSNKLISINTASKEELMTLSGIGESKALAIIKYREDNGLFSNIEDLKNITGIGDKMFEKIKDSITL